MAVRQADGDYELVEAVELEQRTQRRAGDAEANGALQRALADLTRLQVLTMRTLAAADLDALAVQYLGAPLEPDSSLHLVERSEGNPFIAKELLRDWVETGALTLLHGCWQYESRGGPSLPAGIVNAIRQRLERVAPPLLGLLRTAALLGRSFDVPLLAKVSAGDAEATEELLRTAARLRLLTAMPDWRFAFSHDAIRTCLYDGINLTRRRHLHGQRGLLVEARGGTRDAHCLAELAFHFVRSGDQARGVFYTRQAGDAALELWAPAEAAAHYRSALELLAPGDERRAAATSWRR